VCRDVNFQEFNFSIREFQISKLVEYSKQSTLAWMTHGGWKLQHSRHDAMPLWLSGGPWVVVWQEKLQWCRITNRSRLSFTVVVVSCQTQQTVLCWPMLIKRSGCKHSTMNSPGCADILGRVYSLVEVAATGIRVVLQIMISYSAVLIKWQIQLAALGLLTPIMPLPLGLPIDPHIAAGGSPPQWVSTHWELITIEWIYSGYRMDLHTGRQQVASLILLTVVKPS